MSVKKHYKASSDLRCLGSMNFKVHQNTLHRGVSVLNNDAFIEAAAFPTFLPLSRRRLDKPTKPFGIHPGLVSPLLAIF